MRDSAVMVADICSHTTDSNTRESLVMCTTTIVANTEKNITSAITDNRLDLATKTDGRMRTRHLQMGNSSRHSMKSSLVTGLG